MRPDFPTATIGHRYALAARLWGPSPMLHAFVGIQPRPPRTQLLPKLSCHHDGPFHTVDDLELVTCSWVCWFNTNRNHSSIGYNTPIEHENAYFHHHNTGQQQLTGKPSLH